MTADSVELLDDDDRTVGVIWPSTLVTVEEMDGQRCFIRCGAQWGWIDADDVVSFTDSLEFRSAQLRRSPTAENYRLRSLTYGMRGEFKLAIADLDEAVSLAPGAAKYVSQRGMIRILAGDMEGAAADLEHALRLDPRFANAHAHRSLIPLLSGDYAGALADLDEAVRLEPRNAGFRRSRGTLLLMMMGRHRRGLADLDEAIRLDPDGEPGAESRIGRAWYWKRVGRFDAALEDCLEAVRITPRSDQCCGHLAWLLATCPVEKLRDGQAALEHAFAACRLTKFTKANAIESLAAAYAELGDFKKAVEWQEFALEIASESEKAEFESRLALYRNRRPCRHAPTFETSARLPVVAAKPARAAS